MNRISSTGAARVCLLGQEVLAVRLRQTEEGGPVQGPHLAVHGEGGGGVRCRVTPVRSSETGEMIPSVEGSLPNLSIESLSRVVLLLVLVDLVLNELLLLHGLLPGVGHPEGVVGVHLEVAVVVDSVVERYVLVTEVLMGTSHSPVDDDEDEE